MLNEQFDFEGEAKKYYGVKVATTGLSEIVDIEKADPSSQEADPSKAGIYALYDECGILKKIGKAFYDGIHHRMVQYYNGKSGSDFITALNRDKITVKFFNLKDKEELWYAERRLQVIAHDCHEKMEWENTSRN